MEKRSLKVGDIVRTEHGDAYCIINLYSVGRALDDGYLSALNWRGIVRSIHKDSIVEVIEHTDFIDEMMKRLEMDLL